MSTTTYTSRPSSNLPRSRQVFSSNARPLTGRDTDVEEVIARDRKTLKGRGKKARELGIEFADKILTPVDQAITLLQERISNIRTAVSSGQLRLSDIQAHAIEAVMRHNAKLARLNEIIAELQSDASTLEASGKVAENENLRITHGMNAASVSKMIRIEIGSTNQEIDRIRGRMKKDSTHMSYYTSLRIEAIRLANEISEDIRSAVVEQVARNERRFAPLRAFVQGISNLGRAFSEKARGVVYQTAAIVAAFVFIISLSLPATIRNANAAPPTPTPAVREEVSAPGLSQDEEQRIFAYFNGLYDNRLPEKEFGAVKELFLEMRTKDRTLGLKEFIALYNFHRKGSYDAIFQLWKNDGEKKKILAMLDVHLQTKRQLKNMISTQGQGISEEKRDEIESGMMRLLAEGMFQKAKERTFRGKDGMGVYRVYRETIFNMCSRELENAKAGTSVTSRN